MDKRLEIIWTSPALDDLDEIAASIARENPQAAEALLRRIRGTVERLQDHPSSGRWVPELPRKTYREVIVPPCRVIYRREADDIMIVQVIRSERQLDPNKLF